MNEKMMDIPFDHYQRYAPAAALLAGLLPLPESVLEVGANEQRLLAEFLPEMQFVFSDLFPQINADRSFVQADATALPFAAAQFDAVVCLDVLEHIPREKREQAAVEMARVAKRLVVIGCPLDKPWVVQAESAANSVWSKHFGSNYPWLDEHKEFGLVDGDSVEVALRNAGMHVLRFGQGDPTLWAMLMSGHFLKEAFTEFRPLVAAADNLYNRSVFLGDRSEHGYREFFVAARSEEDLAVTRCIWPAGGSSSNPVRDLLMGLPALLGPIGERIENAETQWQETAKKLKAAENSQSIATKGWEETLGRLREVELALTETAQDLEKTRSARHETELALGEAVKRAIELERAGSEAAQRSIELEKSLSAEAQRIVELDRALSEETQRATELKSALLEEASARAEVTLARDILWGRVCLLEQRQRTALWLFVGAVSVGIVAGLVWVLMRWS